MTKKQKRNLSRILICAPAWLLVTLLPLDFLPKLCLTLGIYFLIGYDVLWKALQGISNRQWVDENFLMAVATVGAIVLAIGYGGELTEAVAVMLFYQIGELFQSIAVRKSRSRILALAALRPDTAYRKTEDGRQGVDPDEVEIGSVLEIRAGERIPLDGVILSGSTQIDTAPLTGESLPKEAAEEDEVFSGCVNLTGTILVRTTKKADQSTAARMLELVEGAAERKSAPEQFITRFARVYTPAVCLCALALAIGLPLLSLLLGKAPAWEEHLYRALSFLVISCPCALVVSVPLSFFAGIGTAGKRGILVKGSAYLEALAKTSRVAMDKTGTLTEGRFSVDSVSAVDGNTKRLIYYTAHAQSQFSHPISQSILRFASCFVDPVRITETQQITGEGILSTVDGVRVAAGNAKLMAREGISFPEAEEDATVVYVALDGRYAGRFLLRDRIKPSAAEALRELKQLGVKKTLLLTGDALAPARYAAESLAIDELHCALLPQDKLALLEEELRSLKKNEALIYVGDGINDAPVLARADVGIAMGAMGSDAAIEAADAVILDDDPKKLALAVAIGKKTVRIVRQNIVFSLGVKLLCLILGALGITGMGTAIFADVGVLVLAIGNSLRAMHLRLPASDKKERRSR